MIDFVEKIGINRIYEIHVNSPLHKNGKRYDIDEPFYRSEEAKEMLGYALEESLNRGLALNIECDKNILEQVEICRRQYL